MPIRDRKTGRTFLNLTEIAERWDMNLATVLRSHVGDGRLKTIRHGRAHLVDVIDLAHYEETIRAELRARINSYQATLETLKKPLPGMPGAAKGLVELRDLKR